MNFLDSLLDKIPIIKDMDKKKRILAAGFLVFAVVSLLGILIDAIAEAGGVVALIAVAIGFLLMAAIIIADFIMSRRPQQPDYPPKQEQYSFFDDNPDDYGYQEESSGYLDDDGRGEGFDSPDFRDDFNGDRDFRDDRDYRDEPDFRDDRDYRDYLDDRDLRDYRDFGGDRDYRDDEIEYTVEPEPVYEPVREIQREPEPSRRTPSRFEFRPSSDQNSSRPAPSFDDNVIGKPVMTFDAPSQPLRDEVKLAADEVAPGIVRPVLEDTIGGPVMSIPFRGAAPEVKAEPKKVEVVKPQPIQPAYQPAKEEAAAQREERGQEIEEFFDHMSDDEILYSDCVEVWASDAKPAAVRLLKQVESLTDKKMADSLGKEAEYVNAMLDRIYYFTMLDSIRDNLELKKYNFSAMVKECLRRFSPFFMDKRIGLLWKGLDIDIVTDKRWLIFALTQVVFNAVEFTGLGGKIAISAKKEGSMVHLMVDDSGCGISDEDLPHIFMAGFMGDNAPNESGRRTGMGLFITRSVVEKLGGSVTAESTVGKGTRITMILPEKQ